MLTCSIQKPNNGIRCGRTAGHTCGHNKEEMQLFPSWLSLGFLPLIPDQFVMWVGLELFAAQTFPGFPLFAFTLSYWQKRGVWLSRSVNTHLSYLYQWPNLPVAWISVSIVKALTSTQGGTARHSQAAALALFSKTCQSASFCLEKLCRHFSKSCKLPWGYAISWGCMTDQYLPLLPFSMFQLNLFNWWIK